MRRLLSYQNIIIFSFCFIVLIVYPLSAQPKKGIYGVTTTISKGFIQSANMYSNTNSMNIGMAYMPSDRINIRCELGFLSQKDTSEAKSSEFTFTTNVWYYLQTSENVSTFLGGGVGFGSATDAAGKGTSLLNLGGYFGAEYWFSPRFSWFGHFGVVYVSYKIAERPASDIFTSATTGITWYFGI